MVPCWPNYPAIPKRGIEYRVMGRYAIWTGIIPKVGWVKEGQVLSFASRTRLATRGSNYYLSKNRK
ncbi:hypothetical protein Rmet_6622 (plasmid) [Cupriavidus metallidurans CH34]|uniref:Uncharacterized protein n=1 Tax=Cupriavidus metallidurans (strain ATCC 43123 / DSM 2839 / NBRC 102507 / CH34) TaxID=266264 RepID=D3DY51_CUPMC|nr:hypothetical protein Rmet_6622 [Cupriavidus metallidurans CH34]